MQPLKQSVRSAKNPLKQAVLRLREKKTKDYSPGEISLAFSTKPPNNCYFTVEDKPVELLEKVSSTSYRVRIFHDVKDFFNWPMNSQAVGFYAVDVRDTSLRVLHISKIAVKAFKLNAGENTVFVKFRRDLY